MKDMAMAEKPPKQPPYENVRIKKSKVEGLEAYGMDDDVELHMKGKVKGINETFDKKDVEYTIMPSECNIMHSGKKAHKAGMMKKGMSGEEYDKSMKMEK